MADLMTVAKALAFVDELVLLDDDCTRPELAMRVLAAEVRRLQKLEDGAIRVLTGSLCERHQAEVRTLSLQAFVDRETRGGCVECRQDVLKAEVERWRRRALLFDTLREWLRGSAPDSTYRVLATMAKLEAELEAELGADSEGRDAR